MNLTFNLSQFINDQLKANNISSNPEIGEGIAAIIFFISAIVIGWIVYHIFEHYFAKWAQKTKTTLDDEIIKNVKKPVYFFVILVGFYYGLAQLSMLLPYAEFVSLLFTIAEILLATFIITRIINVLVAWYTEKAVKQGKRNISENILIIFKKFLHGIVYLIALLFILHSFHIDLSGVVVGVGVGGIAIAFALQNILSDVFSAFSIYFDRPFEIGDFIMVGNHAGTVKKIGLKSTRLELLQGEELILSNREATTTSIRNFKKMEKRRVEFTLCVAPNTDVEKLRRIPDIVRSIIEHNKKDTEYNMVHFTDFSNIGLNYQVVYYIKTGDYTKYLDIQQEINLAIMEAFRQQGIELGFQSRPLKPL